MSAPTLPADPPDLRANIKNAARWLLDEAAHGRWGPIETVPPVVPTDARMARGVADLLIALADNRDLWKRLAEERGRVVDGFITTTDMLLDQIDGLGATRSPRRTTQAPWRK